MNLHYGNVDELPEGMSGDLFQWQMSEPSVTFRSKAGKCTFTLMNKRKAKSVSSHCYSKLHL